MPFKLIPTPAPGRDDINPATRSQSQVPLFMIDPKKATSGASSLAAPWRSGAKGDESGSRRRRRRKPSAEGGEKAKKKIDSVEADGASVDKVVDKVVDGYSR